MLPLSDVKKVNKFIRMLRNSCLFSEIMTDDSSITITLINDSLSDYYIRRVIKLTYKFCAKSGYKVKINNTKDNKYNLTFVKY